jgi:FixJ family two-component response regulator
VKTALERGASKFITKPVDFPQLKQDVSRVVADAKGADAKGADAKGADARGIV